MTATRRSPATRLRLHLHSNPDHYKWVALSNTTLGLPGNFETVQQLSGAYGNILEYGLPTISSRCC